MTTLSEAYIYDTAEQAKKIEADFILQRSIPRSERKKKEQRVEKEPKEEKKEEKE